MGGGNLAQSGNPAARIKALTVLAVEADLPLVLLLALQGLVHLGHGPLAGLVAVQEAAGAVLLHDLGADEAGQLAEAVRAVNDGVAMATLSVPQQKVAVCGEKNRRRRRRRRGLMVSIITTKRPNPNLALSLSLSCFLSLSLSLTNLQSLSVKRILIILEGTEKIHFTSKMLLHCQNNIKINITTI